MSTKQTTPIQFTNVSGTTIQLTKDRLQTINEYGGLGQYANRASLAKTITGLRKNSCAKIGAAVRDDAAWSRFYRRYRTGVLSDGTFFIGCQKFSSEQFAQIKKWAKAVAVKKNTANAKKAPVKKATPARRKA